jgi:hypothetical protein
VRIYVVWKRHTLSRFINGNVMDIHTRITAALHTVIGVYTLWALLGKQPAPPHHIEGRP